MLNLSEKHDLPEWDQVPETQIVEIDRDADLPSLPPGMEQKIIDDILNDPTGVLKLPEMKKPLPQKSLN